MQNDQTKIFCIGLSKTGTTSLAAALEILGYRTRDHIGVTEYIAGDIDSSVDLSEIDNNDAFTDTPIPSFYQELDVRYPGSKFILTVRETDGWLKSCKKQFNQRSMEKRNDAGNLLFRDIYDTSIFEEEKFIQGYKRFKDGVLDYFKKRPDDLLVINIIAGEGWEKLCPFLAKTIPDQPFPKANVTQIQWLNSDDLIAIANAAGRELLKKHSKIAELHRTTDHGLMNRIRKAMYGDGTSLLNKAINESHRSIVNGLQKLTPNVPVISDIDQIKDYSERKSWNHIWLIDPLNGIEPYINNDEGFCLSFSLIQDGKPVCGVIYNPKTDTVYYAKRGNGSYLKERDNAPVKFEKSVKTTGEIYTAVILNHQQQNLEEVENYLKKTYSNLHQSIETAPLSTSLVLCRIARGEADTVCIAGPTKEWETAAAQAILQELGKTLCDFETLDENRYNKPNLNNNRVIAQ